MRFAMQRLIKNLEEMEEFAAEVTQNLRGGEVLLLSGPLGAGKTTFTQALARALGVKDKVNSPSYTIAAEYVVSSHPAIKKLVHVDLYRLPEHSAGNDPAVRDFLERVDEPGRLTVIEWAERLSPVKSLRGHGVTIKFDYGSMADERVIEVV